MTPFTVCVLAKQALVHVICTSECMALYLANQLRESASISPSDLVIYPATRHETERLNFAGISGEAFLVERVYEDKFFEQLEAQFR
jgi:hypothetical protein